MLILPPKSNENTIPEVLPRLEGYYRNKICFKCQTEIMRLYLSHQLWQLVKFAFQIYKNVREDNETSFTLWVMKFETQLNGTSIADQSGK